MTTPELTKEQAQALNQIWDQIGADILACYAEGSTLSRGEVIAIVMDADRPTTMFPNVDWSSFYAMSHTDRVMASWKAFKYPTYGC